MMTASEPIAAERRPGFRPEFLLYAMVILTPFQDTALRSVLRHMGTSFASLPVLALVLIDCALWLASPSRTLNRRWLLAAGYVLLLNVVTLLLFGIEWNGVNLIAKVCTLSLMTAVALYVVFRHDWLKLPHLGTAVKIAFAIAVAGVLIGDLNLFGLKSLVNNPLLHQTDNPDTRWRGLTSEASTLSINLGSLGLLSAALTASAAAKVLILALTVLMLALGASKGAVLALGAVGTLVVLLSKGTRARTVTLVALLLPAGYLSLQSLQTMSTAQAISDTTTAATRGAIILWAVRVMAHNPLGVGFGGFYPALSAYLPDTLEAVSANSPLPLNFEEVVAYASSAENVSTKTLLFNFGAYFGMPFLIVFATFIGRLAAGCIRSRKPALLAVILFVTAGVCTYSDPIVYYNICLVYGIGWRQYKASQHAGGNTRFSISTDPRRQGRHVGPDLSFEPARALHPPGGDRETES